jgi:hypothetical protein
LHRFQHPLLQCGLYLWHQTWRIVCCCYLSYRVLSHLVILYRQICLCKSIFLSVWYIFKSTGEEQKEGRVKMATCGGSHNVVGPQSKRPTITKPLFTHASVYAKFARGVMSFDCNLLKLQMRWGRPDT